MSTLVLDAGASVAVSGATVAFDFKNGADPKAFFDSGAFTLDTFMGLSDGHAFSSEFSLNGAFAGDTFTASSTDYAIKDFVFTAAGGATGLVAEPVPEPTTLALLAVPMALLVMRRRKP